MYSWSISKKWFEEKTKYWQKYEKKRIKSIELSTSVLLLPGITDNNDEPSEEKVKMKISLSILNHKDEDCKYKATVNVRVIDAENEILGQKEEELYFKENISRIVDLVSQEKVKTSRSKDLRLEITVTLT